MARKRGRPARDIVRTTVYLEEVTFGKVEMYLIDPKKGKLKYGALSTLLNSLLERFLQQVEASDRDPVEIFKGLGVDLMDTTSEKEKENDNA